jgi:hypothetical protein
VRPVRLYCLTNQKIATSNGGHRGWKFFKTTGTKQSGRTAGTFGTDFVFGDCLHGPIQRWVRSGLTLDIEEVMSGQWHLCEDPHLPSVRQIATTSSSVFGILCVLRPSWYRLTYL